MPVSCKASITKKAKASRSQSFITSSALFAERWFIGMKEKLKVAYIGCGMSAAGGCFNLDNSPSVVIGRHKALCFLLDKLHMLKQEQKAFIDVIKERNIYYGCATKLPFKNSSMDLVYSSHTVEHLYQRDFIKFMKEADRVLRPGGVFRMAIPDLAICAEKYMNSRDADAFCASMGMGFRDEPSLVEKISLIAFGDRGHKWMYDGKSMKSFIERNSVFNDVVILKAGETTMEGNPMIDLREREGESVYLECRRK